MRHRFEKRVALILIGLASLLAIWALPCVAQDDPNDVPLGDVARNLRKKPAPGQNVIDDDNFSKALNQMESKRASSASLKYAMAADSKSFQVSAPDVTCSLSFSANAKALLSSQYAQMGLPAGDLEKLRGPATIEGDALTLSLFNGTDWHVSEVAVAFTLVRKNAPAPSAFADTTGIASANPAPAVPDIPADVVRPEKKPDVTVIYHMRAVAPPLSRAVFSAPLNLDLAAGDEWHWAIVEAKGYPPEDRSLQDHLDQNRSETAAPGNEPPAATNPQPSNQQVIPASMSDSQ